MILKLKEFLRLFLKSIYFLSGFKGIVFFGGYPYPERENDGYFVRVKAIDQVFSDCTRIYIDDYRLPGRNALYDWPDQNTLVIRLGGPWKRNILTRAFMLFCILKCRRIYLHSVISIKAFQHLLSLPGIKTILDVHGAVPEEFELHHDRVNAELYGHIERQAVTQADLLIVVSENMCTHLQEKYPDQIQGQFVRLPIFKKIQSEPERQPKPDQPHIVVYAGGLQKWQQIPKMIAAIDQTIHQFKFRVFCPDPAAFINLLPSHLQANPALTVGSKSSDEILEVYQGCHFGFILREEHIVNRVACPTKLTEYLAMGVIPIVDSDQIGDFKALGMQSISLEDFLVGRVPDPAALREMVKKNLEVYQDLNNIYEAGMQALRVHLYP